MIQWFKSEKFTLAFMWFTQLYILTCGGKLIFQEKNDTMKK